MVKVLVCGDRNWANRESIYQVLNEFPFDTIIIHGAAPGADSIADEIATEFGFQIERFPANWNFGPRGGPIRNRQMLTVGKPDLVIAFHKNIAKSKGTKNMLLQATLSGVPTKLYAK